MLSLLITSMLSLGRAPEVRGEARAGGRPRYTCPTDARARAPPRARLWGPVQGEHAGYEQGEHAGYEQGEHAGYEQGFSHIKWGIFLTENWVDLVHRKLGRFVFTSNGAASASFQW